MTHHLPTLALACLLLTGVAQAQVIENQPITATPAVYRFGVDARWAYAYVPTASSCTRQVFGSDPAPGVVKRCEPVPINAASCVLPALAWGQVSAHA